MSTVSTDPASLGRVVEPLASVSKLSRVTKDAPTGFGGCNQKLMQKLLKYLVDGVGIYDSPENNGAFKLSATGAHEKPNSQMHETIAETLYISMLITKATKQR